MKIKPNRTASAVVLALLCPISGLSQEKTVPRTWEFGLGGAAMNITRTTVSNFRQTPGGDYIFNLDEKLLYGGIEIYSAIELNRWLYADLQGTLGLARYDDAEKERQGYSLMVSPGIQIRPFRKSEWIQPYIRLGVNLYHKNFPTSYFGQFNGDVTKEAFWKAEDAWNKGYTFDSDTFFPVSAGIGVIGWISNKVGMHIQGQYNRSLGTDGVNFAQVSAGIVLRLGGADKHKASADRYVPRHLDDYAALYPQKVVEKEVVREVPVEVVREVIKEVPSEKTLAEMMGNVNFDFDKATITADSQFVLDEIANTLARFTGTMFLVAGYTDAKGSDEYNEELSRARAKAVYEALLQRGIQSSRLCYKGFGKRVALVPESATDEQRRGDRKVVLERVTSESLWNYLNQHK